MDRPEPAETVYTGLLGKIVRTLDPGTEADPVGVLGSLMVGFSAYIGPYARVRISDLDNHPVLIWALLIGNTSKGKKGSATSAAMTVLKMIDSGFFRTNLLTGLSSGEGLISDIKDPEVDDMTEEELFGFDPDDVGGERRFVVEPEYGQTMLRSSGLSSLSTVLRQAWDGSDLKVRTRKKPLSATNPHVAILGHISPKEFRDRMSERELAGGTYNRYLAFHVHQSKSLPSGGKVDMAALKELATELMVNADKARMEKLITRTEDAEEYWVNTLYNQINDNEPDDEVLEQFVARRAPYTLRLAALYALADGREHIGVRDLKAADALYEYSVKSVEHTLSFQAPAMSRAPLAPTTPLGKLARAIENAGDAGLSRSDLYDVVGRATKKTQLEEMLEQLPVETRPIRTGVGSGRAGLNYYWVSEDGADGFV